MRFHASCAARPAVDGPQGVLLCGPPGSGKSDLLLRLLQRGFELVADDQVLVETGMARAPVSLAGLIEVRGLGIIRMAYLAETPLLLVVQLGIARERLPVPAAHAALGLPMVTIDPATPSAPDRLIMALDCAAGRVQNVAGAFTA